MHKFAKLCAIAVVTVAATASYAQNPQIPRNDTGSGAERGEGQDITKDPGRLTVQPSTAKSTARTSRAKRTAANSSNMGSTESSSARNTRNSTGRTPAKDSESSGNPVPSKDKPGTQ